MSKPSIPKGTRDFLPLQARKRAYLFNAIQEVFALYGYDPIETPAMEHGKTLLGKYGEEGDRLIFKLLKRGDKLKQAQEKQIELSDQALRYDLTVPFARFVVQNQSALSFPFKRYQIQPVWRADRPQKGRYREFYQCDVDVIGSESLSNEIELISIIDQVFTKLNLEGISIKLNNRKILAGIATYIGHEDLLTPITIAMDKQDKIGLEKVKEELLTAGISSTGIEKLEAILSLSGSWTERLRALKTILVENPLGLKGIAEVEEVLGTAEKIGVKGLELDLSLARGLNYYTGAIFEVVTKDFPSSICGGGRYDDLTGLFGLNNMSGVGISFGADRIYDVLEDRNGFPKDLNQSSQVLFINFGVEEAAYSLQLAMALRKQNISAEVYPESSKLKKQFSYAHAKHIPFVVTIGSNEIEKGIFKVKEMSSGVQKEMNKAELIILLKDGNTHF